MELGEMEVAFDQLVSQSLFPSAEERLEGGGDALGIVEGIEGNGRGGRRGHTEGSERNCYEAPYLLKASSCSTASGVDSIARPGGSPRQQRWLAIPAAIPPGFVVLT